MSVRLRTRVLTYALGALALCALFGVALRRHARQSDPANARESSALPLERLPKGASALSRTLEPELPAQALWSRLSSELCGGYDVFESAMQVAETGRHQETLIRHLSAPRAELRAALECGQRFAIEPRAAVEYWLSFSEISDAKKSFRGVGIVASPLEIAPKPSGSFREARATRLQQARCVRDSQAECDGRAKAAARIEDELWSSGGWSDLQALGNELGDAQEQPRFAELATRLAAYPRWYVGLEAEWFKHHLINRLFAEPFPERPKESDELEAALREAVAGYGFGQDARELRSVILTHNETFAPRLEQALRRYFEAIARRLRGEQPRTPGSGFEPLEVLDYEHAKQAVRRRAWRAPHIERTENRIEISLSLQPEPDEQHEILVYETWRRARRQSAARLVDALIEGTNTEDALRAIGGDYLVRFAARGYRPYFEGNWVCPASEGRPERRLSFSQGKLTSSEDPAKVEGTYGYQVQSEGDEPKLLLRIDRAGSSEALRIEAWRGSILIAPVAQPDTQRSCHRLGERTLVEPPPARPDPFVFDLPEPADGKYYEARDLEALGLSFEKLDDRESLLHGFDPASALCFEALPCEIPGECMTLRENLEAFRAALVPGKERQVSCEWAETGHCGEFRYFVFEGDIYRYEVRWFDAAGRLVAQRNTTDYPAYCNGRASGRFQGRMPYCRSPVRDELVCGQARRPVSPPLEDLRVMLRTAFERQR